MKDLGWNVKIQSFTEQNKVLNKPVQFNNIIATLDEKVSLFTSKNKVKIEVIYF